jgi:hypothetical protein
VQAAHAAAADEVDVVVRCQAGLLQTVLEAGIALHRRVDLPGDQDSLLRRFRQIRHADEIPLRIGPHIYQLRVGPGFQRFPCLGWRDILDHINSSEME